VTFEASFDLGGSIMSLRGSRWVRFSDSLLRVL
jgi:hypothetical protein